MRRKLIAKEATVRDVVIVLAVAGLVACGGPGEDGESTSIADGILGNDSVTTPAGDPERGGSSCPFEACNSGLVLHLDDFPVSEICAAGEELCIDHSGLNVDQCCPFAGGGCSLPASSCSDACCPAGYTTNDIGQADACDEIASECPIEWECSRNCFANRNCEIVDTGDWACDADGDRPCDMQCEGGLFGGKTIHLVQCECEGDGPCGTLTDQHLACY